MNQTNLMITIVILIIIICGLVIFNFLIIKNKDFRFKIISKFNKESIDIDRSDLQKLTDMGIDINKNNLKIMADDFSDISNNKYCNHCAALIDENSIYCKVCGKKQE